MNDCYKFSLHIEVDADCAPTAHAVRDAIISLAQLINGIPTVSYVWFEGSEPEEESDE